MPRRDPTLQLPVKPTLRHGPSQFEVRPSSPQPKRVRFADPPRRVLVSSYATNPRSLLREILSGKHGPAAEKMYKLEPSVVLPFSNSEKAVEAHGPVNCKAETRATGGEAYGQQRSGRADIPVVEQRPAAETTGPAPAPPPAASKPADREMSPAQPRNSEKAVEAHGPVNCKAETRATGGEAYGQQRSGRADIPVVEQRPAAETTGPAPAPPPAASKPAAREMSPAQPLEKTTGVRIPVIEPLQQGDARQRWVTAFPGVKGHRFWKLRPGKYRLVDFQRDGELRTVLLGFGKSLVRTSLPAGVLGPPEKAGETFLEVGAVGLEQSSQRVTVKWISV